MTSVSEVPKNVSFALGGFVGDLSEQLSGCGLSAEQLSHFQRDNDAISRAHLRRLIPYSQAMKAYDRLSKAILKAARQAQEAGQ